MNNQPQLESGDQAAAGRQNEQAPAAGLLADEAQNYGQDGQDNRQSLPVEKNEDVEFTAELADADDFEALERAAAADYRQEQ